MWTTEINKATALESNPSSPPPPPIFLLKGNMESNFQQIVSCFFYVNGLAHRFGIDFCYKHDVHSTVVLPDSLWWEVCGGKLMPFSYVCFHYSFIHEATEWALWGLEGEANICSASHLILLIMACFPCGKCSLVFIYMQCKYLHTPCLCIHTPFPQTFCTMLQY